MKIKSNITSFAIAFIMAAAPAISYAQAPKVIKRHKAWGAYSYKDAKAGKICYILSVPTAKEPTDRDHGDVFFLISQKPNGASGYEPQVEVGYPLKADSTVTVNVDGKKFPMFVQGNNAWLKNLTNEPDLLTAMRAGSSMKVSAESTRGTRTSYTYSLSGVTAALSEVTKCK